MNQPTQSKQEKRQLTVEWQNVFLNKLIVTQTEKDTLFDLLDTVRELQEFGNPISAVCHLLAERLRTCSDNQYKAERMHFAQAAQLAGLLDRLSADYFVFNNETKYVSVSDRLNIELEKP